MAVIVALMLARDILHAFTGLISYFPLADLAIITLYVFWLRAYTGRSRFDFVYLALNALVCAAGAVNIFIPFLRPGGVFPRHLAPGQRRLLRGVDRARLGNGHGEG